MHLPRKHLRWGIGIVHRSLSLLPIHHTYERVMMMQLEFVTQLPTSRYEESSGGLISKWQTMSRYCLQPNLFSNNKKIFNFFFNYLDLVLTIVGINPALILSNLQVGRWVQYQNFVIMTIAQGLMEGWKEGCDSTPLARVRKLFLYVTPLRRGILAAGAAPD